MASVMFKRLSGLLVIISLISFRNNPVQNYGSTGGGRGKISASNVLDHPIYVSVTEINHNSREKSLEIACKIFAEDLEIVLAKNTGAKIDLFHPKDSILAGRQITDYISKHLQVNVDGKPVKYTLVGFERELDAVWSYFEADGIAATPKTVTIMNDLLYDNFKQQINLMHVTINSKRKSTKLDYPDTNASFDW